MLIVEIAVHSLLLGVREALLIWSLLVVVILVPMATFAYRSRTPHPPAPKARPQRPARVKAAVRSTDDERRYAGEVAVAADRSATTAAYRRVEWLAAQRTRDAAWRAYEAASAARRRVERATAFRLPYSPLTADERVARERYLHKAANEAYRRGELSAEQLIDVLSHRAGWELAHAEFRHNRFDTDEAGQPRASRFYFRADLTNAGREERATLEGDLVVDWTPKASGAELPAVKRIDASRLVLKTRRGKPPFRPILVEPVAPPEKSYFIDPLILYDLDGDGLSEILLAATDLVYRRHDGDRHRRRGCGPRLRGQRQHRAAEPRHQQWRPGPRASDAQRRASLHSRAAARS